MGQAKKRGSQEQRIAHATERSMAPPTEGVYISTKKVQGMRLLVEEVSVSVADDGENDGYFLVVMIDEASAREPEAMRDELWPDEWRSLVAEYGLVVQT